MHASHSISALPFRRNHVSSLVALVLGLAPAAGFAATTWPISSCEDDGTPGTLREVIKAVTTLTGDSVDLAFCSGSTISLQTGAIEIKQDDLTLVGPGAANLQVDGAKLPYYTQGDYRIFTHTGAGTLTLQSLGVTHGHVYHAADALVSDGGCIFSNANVELDDVTVTKCSAYSGKNYARGGALLAYGVVTLKHSTLSANAAISPDTYAKGGAVWAKGDVSLFQSHAIGNAVTSSSAIGGAVYANTLSLSYSMLSGNSATAPQGLGFAYAGGADTLDSFSCDYSTIDGNSANGDATVSVGGGVWSHGDATIKRCTISNNHSDGAVGGLAFVDFNSSAHTVEVRHSTISGNTAGSVVGGMSSFFSTTRIYNSTIAFNTAVSGTVAGPSPYYGPGLALSSKDAAMVATLGSSLLSNNTYGAGIEVDLTTATTALHPITFNASPANNLVRNYLANGLPDDTIAKACPLLGPLRDNGGPTKTHALLSSSVAIDAGNNFNGDDQDQRGLASDVKPFPYPRVSILFADIGAYEVNQDDIVFNSAFEGCVDLN
jgi:hypothetical protein